MDGSDGMDSARRACGNTRRWQQGNRKNFSGKLSVRLLARPGESNTLIGGMECGATAQLKSGGQAA
jgi:hypothetical protein